MLSISTGDCVVGYVAVDLSWRRCGRTWGDRSLLGTELKGMVLLIPTGDDAEENDTVYLYWGRCVGYGVVYLYWRRCGRLWRSMSLLTVW